MCAMLSKLGQFEILLAYRNWSIDIMFSAVEVLLNEDVWLDKMPLSNHDILG